MRLRLLLAVLLTLAFGAAKAALPDSLGRLPRPERLAALETCFDALTDNPIRAAALFTQLKDDAKQTQDHALEAACYCGYANFQQTLGNEALRNQYRKLALELTSRYDLSDQHTAYLLQSGFDLLHADSTKAQGVERLLTGSALMRKAVYARFPRAGDYLLRMGNVFFEYHDPDNALPYLIESLAYLKESRSRINAVNTIATIYRDRGDRHTALRLYEADQALALQAGDSAWYGIISGNIGNTYFATQQYGKAQSFLETDATTSLARKEYASAAGAILRLTEISYLLRNDARGDSLLASVRPVIAAGHNKPPHLAAYFRLMAGHFKKTGDARQEAAYLDSCIRLSEALDKGRVDKMIANTQLRLGVEGFKKRESLLEAEKHNQILRRNFFVITLALGVVILLLILSSQRQRFRQDRLISRQKERLLWSDKMRVEGELSNARQQLGAFVDSIKKKNELLESLGQKVAQLQAGTPIAAQPDQTDILQSLQQATILTEDDWKDFQLRFDRVHKGFFIRLKETYAGLTQAETRLLALEKLDLSTREMAGMLGISPDSVKKARNRLRKKINLSQEDSIKEVVAEI